MAIPKSRLAMTLVLLTALASGQGQIVQPPAPTTPVPDAGSAADLAASYAENTPGGGAVDPTTDTGTGDYSSPASDGGASTSSDYSSGSDYSTSGSSNSNDPASPDPTTGCKTKYQVQTTSLQDCQSFCQTKVDKARNKGTDATIDPTLYPFSTYTCCNCKFKRIKSPPTPPGESPVPSTIDTSPTPGGSSLIKPMDPSTFNPPTQTELTNAANPAYVPNVSSGESMVYVVMRAMGMPWTLPLPYDQILDFIYAFNNVTGAAWQFKGAAVRSELFSFLVLTTSTCFVSP